MCLSLIVMMNSHFGMSSKGEWARAWMCWLPHFHQMLPHSAHKTCIGRHINGGEKPLETITIRCKIIIYIRRILWILCENVNKQLFGWLSLVTSQWKFGSKMKRNLGLIQKICKLRLNLCKIAPNEIILNTAFERCHKIIILPLHFFIHPQNRQRQNRSTNKMLKGQITNYTKGLPIVIIVTTTLTFGHRERYGVLRTNKRKRKKRREKSYNKINKNTEINAKQWSRFENWAEFECVCFLHLYHSVFSYVSQKIASMRMKKKVPMLSVCTLQ